MSMNEDVYFHKTVTLRIGKQQLEFRTSQELFSSHDIDIGSRALLRSFIEAGYAPQRTLDLGCGYGPLGLALKKLFPESTVHMVDRDALAIEYSRQNAKINGLEDVEIYGSLGYDDIKRTDFDLIIANIPGKAGEAVTAYLLQEARYYLAPGGTAAIVVVAALESAVAQILQDSQGLEIVFSHKRAGHAIFHYKFNGEPMLKKPESSALEWGIYHRQDIKIRRENLEYVLQTTYGLPEFDSLSYSSEMLITALNKMQGRRTQRAAVFNPGQGHIAAAVWKIVHPQTLELVDRDLLALRYSRLNLIQNGCPPEKITLRHQVGLKTKDDEKYDFMAGVLKDESKEANLLTLKQATEGLSSGGTILIAAGSTAITRLADYIEEERQLRITVRERRRGYSLLVLEGKQGKGAKDEAVGHLC
jgi:16S rRNA (guanine1207-N2)-methyltransferase